MIRKAPMMHDLDDEIDPNGVMKLETFDDYCRHNITQMYKTTNEEDLRRIAGINEPDRYTKVELIKMLTREI